MPTFEVVGGDTVWGLTRRALTEQLGRRPTNAEILGIVNQVQVPSGNVDLIFPGEQITIPVGPGYGGGDESPPMRGGEGPVGPGAGSAEYPSDMYPDGPFGPPPGAGGGPGDRPGERRVPSPRGPGDRPGEQRVPARTPNEDLRFGPPVFGRGAFDAFRAPEDQIGEYRDFNMRELGDWADLLRESVGDNLGLFARGAGRIPGALGRLPSGVRPALPSGVRPALPAGPRPALPAGPAGGYGSGGRNFGPFQFGAG